MKGISIAALVVFVLGVIGVAAASVFWIVTVPPQLTATDLPSRPADPGNGAKIFAMAGCASCHAAKGAKGDDRLKLAGGQALVTPFGTFHVPNISPDPATGIGNWTDLQIVNAIKRGIGRDGSNLYPAFPYPSYSRMTLADAGDLVAYLRSLPAIVNRVPAHDLKFPFNIRLALYGWKLLFFNRLWNPPEIVHLVNALETAHRGQYIVEGPGHCGECHTPRNALGGPELSRWLAGAPVLEGTGRVPDLTPDAKALGSWSASDIAYYLEAGFTPDGDAVGGAMSDVVENMALLPKPEREAIAAYLKAIPPLPPQPKP